MVCRGGGVWISQTGLSPYNQISDKRAYPPVKGEFEDPVVWRDHVQYHLIVNDWLGRIAFYQRSKDGINWITDPGEAYQPGVSFHEDGKVENWFKYERIKIFQDKYGRAIQANFAVITISFRIESNDQVFSFILRTEHFTTFTIIHLSVRWFPKRLSCYWNNFRMGKGRLSDKPSYHRLSLTAKRIWH